MLNDDVFAVVRVTGNRIGVYHFSISDGVHLIKGFTMLVAVERSNIDAFMKTRVNSASCCLGWIAHKTVLTAFPWSRSYSFKIAFDVLVERGAATRKECVVVGRQCQTNRVILCHRYGDPQTSNE